MKKYIFIVSLLCLLAACTGKRQGEAAVEVAALPAVEDVVMYQVNPRVFAPEKSFKAVERRLDSIQALGINVVWFMPINEVGQEKSVNSPYCVKDYKGVNPEFGTLDEFKALVATCHQKGMNVIIDWVANHTSWDNAWIANKEWYTQDEAGNIIFPAGTGWKDVADLNFDNQEMRLAMIEAMKFWVYYFSAYSDTRRRSEILRELLGGIGDNVMIDTPFHCDYGKNIFLGNNVVINMNCTLVDNVPIRIGSQVLIASNVQIYTASHPVLPQERLVTGWKKGKGTFFRTYALPIEIEDQVWIGGGSILLPGVRIGKGCVIGAGSVVTHSVPAGCVAVGSPCRVIRRF